MRYHFTLTRMAITKKTDNWNPRTLLLGLLHGAVLWQTAWQFLKELNPELPHNPKIPLVGVYPREIKTYSR